MPGLGGSPPCHLVDEVDGFLAVPDRVRMTAVDRADRPLDLGHLLERGGDRVRRAAEQPKTCRLAGHALASAPVRSVRQGRVHRLGPSLAEACPHLILAVAGDVQVALHDIQRALAARHKFLVGGAGSKPIDRIASGIRSSAWNATLTGAGTSAFPDGPAVAGPLGAAQAAGPSSADGSVPHRPALSSAS